MDYRWVQTGTLTTESPVRALSWNLEGTRLLTAGALVQLWHLNQSEKDLDPKVVFTLGGSESNIDGSGAGDQSPNQGKLIYDVYIFIVKISLIFHREHE